MVQFKAFMPNVEASGKSMMSIIDAMGSFKKMAINILKSTGIDNLNPDKWYSQQAWLDSFKQISEHIGFSALFKIGLKVPGHAFWPQEINSVESALKSIDIAYHMNHRLNGEVLYNPQNNKMKEGIGHYLVEKITPEEITLICNNPYPCDFDRGIIEGVAKKYVSPETHIFVKEDSSKPCRNMGADSCTYIITLQKHN